MNPRLLLCFALLAGLVSCKQTAEIAPSEDVTTLQARFHGKYKPISSTSSEALDIDQDGKASTNMLQEIAALQNQPIEVHIYGKSQYNAEPSFSFVHYWPRQEFRPAVPQGYDPTVKVSYYTSVVHWDFAFDQSLTQLQLQPQPPTLTDPEFYTPPQAVTVKEKDRLEVTLTKRLYTTSGWKTVQIVTLYELYTKAT